MKLIIENVVKSYGKKEVIKNASFEFEKGKIYALLGRNGAGKTTLFDCINSDTGIASGKIYLDDGGVEKKLGVSEIGYVLSTPSVPSFLTAREFIKFFIDVNSSKIVGNKSVDEWLDMVGIIDEDKDRILKDFSLGMKNKIQMLVSFIARPDVLLLDEPLTSFDVVVAEEMKNLLRDLKKENIIIFSTHIMEIAMELCDEIAILSDGKLTKVDKDKELIIEKLKSI